MCDCYEAHCAASYCGATMRMHLGDGLTKRSEVEVYCHDHSHGRNDVVVWLYSLEELDEEPKEYPVRCAVRWLTSNARRRQQTNHPNFFWQKREDGRDEEDFDGEAKGVFAFGDETLYYDYPVEKIGLHEFPGQAPLKSIGSDGRELRRSPDGAFLIAAERLRQVEGEGYDAVHDSDFSGGALAEAASCYALDVVRRLQGGPPEKWDDDPTPEQMASPEGWPWDYDCWKPTPGDPIRQLTKAGALIAAEIDRLLRAAKGVFAPEAFLSKRILLPDVQVDPGPFKNVLVALSSYIATIKRENQHEWMVGLADRMTLAAKALGYTEVFEYDARSGVLVQVPLARAEKGPSDGTPDK